MGLVVGVTYASVVPTQRLAAIWLAIGTIVNVATGVIARLNPRAGRTIDERVEEAGFSDDDLDDLAIQHFCKMAHAV